jgi:hypothetical protein
MCGLESEPARWASVECKEVRVVQMAHVVQVVHAVPESLQL